MQEVDERRQWRNDLAAFVHWVRHPDVDLEETLDMAMRQLMGGLVAEHALHG